MLRGEAGEKSLLLDGGDTWQGSAISLFTNGMDHRKIESRNAK